MTGVADYEKGACEGTCTDAAVDTPATDTNTACPADMVLIAGGSYVPVGKPAGGIVRIDALCVDKTEVIESAYRACVASGTCTAPAANTHCNYGIPGRENDPINCVNLTQAKGFCEFKGRRLPTEDEWEWVARGGPLGFAYPWGNAAPSGTDDPERLCWQGKTVHNDPGKWPTRPAGTCPVGSFPSGARDSILDLAGNVWEWTSTPFDATKFISRGGSAFDDPDAKFYNVGARLPGASAAYSGVGVRCFKGAS